MPHQVYNLQVFFRIQLVVFIFLSVYFEAPKIVIWMKSNLFFLLFMHFSAGFLSLFYHSHYCSSYFLIYKSDHVVLCLQAGIPVLTGYLKFTATPSNIFASSPWA